MKTRKPATAKPDRVAVDGGAACPRCGQAMQRFRRPEGYRQPNETPDCFIELLLPAR